jgi:hypothetical protein
MTGKVYFTASPEFWAELRQALPYNPSTLWVEELWDQIERPYGWNSERLGFVSSKADPDIWMCKGWKPNGSFYWEYALCYVDDILVFSHQPNVVMDAIVQHVTQKPGSAKPPDSYLGANVFQVTIHDGNQDIPIKKHGGCQQQNTRIEQLEKLSMNCHNKMYIL